jgi:hypothetical protein
MSHEYYLIDKTAFYIWNFGRDDFLSTGKLSTASIFGHRRIFHSVLPNLPNLPKLPKLPKHAYKIVVDGIESERESESHPFHPEIRR